MLVDTHAHIHSEGYRLSPDMALQHAHELGVGKILCVGTDYTDNQRAVEFVQNQDNCWATVGLHPHEAKAGQQALDGLAKLITKPKVVAVGECGLDYYYNHSPKHDQQMALRFQIELAIKHNKALIFHVREAFADFFKIIDEYRGIRGVVHSFSSTNGHLQQVLKHGLYVGLNGIMTFTKYQEQLEVAKRVPLDKLVLETDSPFLTPNPKRGQVNEPANVAIIAKFLAGLRGETIEQLHNATSRNAEELFRI